MQVICLLALFLMILFGGNAQARDIIAVSPDKPEIVKLDVDAASIIVGSPKYASVTLDNPRTMLVIPRAEGATSLTVLNSDGEIVMEKSIIVGGPKEKYVRIRRACPENLGGCMSSQTFYCPDGCSDISLDTPEKSANNSNQDIIPLNTPPPIPPIDTSELEPIQ